MLNHVHTKEEILEPCMCALRHLTSRHEEEEKARFEFVSQLNGHLIVAHALHAATAGVCPELGLAPPPSGPNGPGQSPLASWTLVKAVVGLLRNLSMNVDNHAPMLEVGIVAGLSLLLYAAQFEVSKVRVILSCTFPWDDIHLEWLRRHPWQRRCPNCRFSSSMILRPGEG